jgi:hypothetical protein
MCIYDESISVYDENDDDNDKNSTGDPTDICTN